MVCTFYHKELGCLNAYCYYPKSPIDCPAKEKTLNEIGVIYRESTGFTNGNTADATEKVSEAILKPNLYIFIIPYNNLNETYTVIN